MPFSFTSSPASPTSPFTDPSSWLALTGSLLIALLGSNVLGSVATAWLNSRGERRAAKRVSRRADARRALKALQRARMAYLAYGEEPFDHTGNDGTDLSGLATRLFVDCTFTGDKATLQAAKTYVAVGEKFAAQDELTGTEEEEAAFFVVLELLRKYLD